MAQGSMPLARLALFRESTYRLVSQAFLYPDERRLEGVAAAASQLRREGAALARFAFFGEWTRLLELLEQLRLGNSGELQRKFASLFVVSPGGIPCPPYESVYREPAGQPTGWLLAQVEHAYASIGLTLAPDLGELPDHVAVELEFMALLCGREAQAWRQKFAVEGIRALSVQKAFLDSHLALWFSGFARRLAVADSRGGPYAAVGEGTRAFLEYDRDLLDVLLEVSSPEDEASLARELGA